MNIKEILEQIERGLEGVTPGPWRRKPMKGYPDDYVLTDHPDFQQPKHGNLVAECGFSGGKIEHRYEADAAHIARCDPDTMRAIIAHIRELEARSRELDAMQARAEAAEVKVAMAQNLLKRVPMAINNAFAAGIEEREGGSERRQAKAMAIPETLLCEIRATLAAMEATDE